ncbi:MAG: hypothetical protein COZ77_09895 [Gallionellales bacterium CG_4_8_14_3_um_filter_54_18]|nr:MAG: hypothetical protein COZ77_09895 [Gallionellales bacterium CG_4_8_14_3_um_filter_54_18]
MPFHKVHMILPCGLLALSLMTLALPTNVSATVCNNNSQCDDGLFCNGLELCRPADPLALPNGCVEWIEPPGVNGRFTGQRRVARSICRQDDNPYTRDYCDEEEDLCRHASEDVDGDGHASIRTGGDDCNDADAMSYPGNVEICDPAGRNEDCDPMTVGRRDTDGDGYTDSSCYNTGPDGKRIYDRSRH